jgi:hypothetical protein
MKDLFGPLPEIGDPLRVDPLELDPLLEGENGAIEAECVEPLIVVVDFLEFYVVVVLQDQLRPPEFVEVGIDGDDEFVEVVDLRITYAPVYGNGLLLDRVIGDRNEVRCRQHYQHIVHDQEEERWTSHPELVHQAVVHGAGITTPDLYDTITCTRYKYLRVVDVEDTREACDWAVVLAHVRGFLLL